MIIEMFIFIAQTMSGIINAFDNVYLGSYSMLDFFIAILYLNITLWGIFSLLGKKDNGSVS